MKKKKEKGPPSQSLGFNAFDGEFNDDLLIFLRESPTPFHAVGAIARRLEAAGFHPLREADAWKVREGDKAFVTRNDSSILAFRMGKSVVEHGFRLVGSHTDSPCLKPKPNPETESCGLVKIGVEIYGGVLLSTWFDRDLSLAGRVTYVAGGRLRNALIDFERPVAVLPNLAIHLNRDVNENRSINKQWEMPPIVCHSGGEFHLRDEVTNRLRAQGVSDVEKVLDYDLCFYDAQPPALTGFRNEFVSSGRLDNLLSCYVGLQAILSAEGNATAVMVANDHEEVGSASSVGAEGPFLRSVLERLCGGNAENLTRAIDRSMFVSTDNAHAVHPNYPEKHDSKHAPFLDRGPALKVNANQRYATTGETGAIFGHLCERAGVPLQKFVSRADMPCGSTIGPLTAKVLGVRTVDVGVPTFAMHSARELAGTKDAPALSRALVEFFSVERLWD